MSKDRSKEILREIRELRKELGSRIERLESAAGLPTKEPAKVEEVEFSEAPPVAAAETVSDPVPAAPVPLVQGSTGSRPVAVTVRPLVDLGLARAVETSLLNSEGVESARLSSLSGDAAVIDTRIAPGVSVIGALRKSLAVAFDVTDSSEDSVTIELVRPDRDEDGTDKPSEAIEN